MKVTAKLNHLRIAPRKVRLVIALIKRKKVEKAQNILAFTIKKSAEPVLKLLNSAIANAKTQELDPENLFITQITVDEGRTLKRWRARARGRAASIEKKTSHITIVLEEIDPDMKRKKVKTEKKDKVEAPKSIRISKKEEAPKKVEEKEQAIEPKQKRTEKRGIEKPLKKGGVKRMFRRKSF